MRKRDPQRDAIDEDSPVWLEMMHALIRSRCTPTVPDETIQSWIDNRMWRYRGSFRALRDVFECIEEDPGWPDEALDYRYLIDGGVHLLQQHFNQMLREFYRDPTTEALRHAIRNSPNVSIGQLFDLMYERFKEDHEAFWQKGQN